MKNLLLQIGSFVLPVTVLIVVPLLIESRFQIDLDFFNVVGILLGLIGLSIFVLTVRMFIQIGRGTLAPWSPTRKLITGSLYGYMRNPMITAVWTMLIAESLVFHSTRILIWAIVFFAINHVYFIVSEEPGLVRRFGDEYAEYQKNVPRWIPRLKPWSPNTANARR
ncbi:MAG: isoprenylcysteine carboxylmethyltransferase family protein [Chloroflexi bacterium]|nr:isoprenylcysteine carboxylmethyltransferase family protein [Chloroflexota bacterium]